MQFTVVIIGSFSLIHTIFLVELYKQIIKVYEKCAGPVIP